MKISELFEVIEVKIPDTDIVVKMKTEMSWFEQIEYASADDSVERGKFLLTSLIEEWNIEDEAGKKLPITKEIVGRLPARIILPIMEAVNKKTGEKNVKKKDLSRSLSRYFRGTGSEIPDEYINYLMCKTFGWTYEQLMNQPAGFIDDMILVMSSENKAKEKWHR